MLKNYFFVAIRHLNRHKLHTSINLLGLSLGLACAFLLLLYIQDEITYDYYFAKHERIYRVWGKISVKDEIQLTGQTPGPIAAYLQENFPNEIEEVTRLSHAYSRSFIYHKPSNKSFVEEQLYYADASFFSVFDCEFIIGNPKDALSEAHSIVLTESLARKFFGSPKKALHKELFYNQFEKGLRVSAVIKNLPSNTSFPFNALISTLSIDDNLNFLSQWGNLNAYTFALFKQSPSPKIEKQLEGLFEKKVNFEGARFNISGSFKLQKLTDIHLSSSEFTMDFAYKGNWQIIYVFSGVLGLILAIASINYMNLTTARASTRAREVGIRKVLGAHRKQLIVQFLLEAVLTSFFALLIALMLVEIFLPFFNQLTHKNLDFDYLQQGFYIPQILILVLIVGLVSGSYPAFLLSSYRPIATLKGRNANLDARFQKGFRQFLVVLQFAISITLIICTGVAIRQLEYINQKNLGFDKSQVLIMEIEGYTCHQAEAIKSELLKIPSIEQVGGANVSLGSSEFNITGTFIEDNKGEMREIIFNTFLADADFFDLMNIDLLAGRNFRPGDSLSAVLVNETLQRNLNWTEAVGKRVSIGQDNEEGRKQPNAKVVGVLEDFHLLSLHQSIEPLVILPTHKAPRFYPSRIYIKLKGNQIENSLQKIEAVYKKFDQKRPFEAYFLDRFFARQYQKDQQQLQILLSFSVVAIIVACLGLFGLTSFTIERRTKEIGLRKVLGASFWQLLIHLNQGFLKLVVLANLLAIPAALWLVELWLASFAYRVPLADTFPVFVASGLLAFLVALVTVSTLAYRINQLKPAEVLQCE